MSQPIQVQVYEQSIVPLLPVRVEAVTYNIHYLSMSSGYIMIDLPPLELCEIETSKDPGSLFHMFLTSHFDTDGLALFVQQSPQVRIHCTNECRKFLLREYGGLANNIDVMTEESVKIEDYEFFSIPTPLLPFPSSQMIYERTTKTLFSHFHHACACQNTHVNFKLEISRFQQAFLPGALTFQRKVLALNITERICPEFGRDWFRSEFGKLNEAVAEQSGAGVFIAFDAETSVLAHRLHMALRKNGVCSAMFQPEQSRMYDAFKYTEECNTLVICSLCENGDLNPDITEFLATMKEYRHFKYLAGMIVCQDEEEGRKIIQAESEELGCAFVTVVVEKCAGTTQVDRLVDSIKGLNLQNDEENRFAFLDKGLNRFLELLEVSQP